MTEETAPVAPQRFGTRVRSIHGDYFDDPWDWLRQRDNPDVIAHVNAENQWAEQVCKPAQELAENLVSEFDSFTAPVVYSAPQRVGDWWYFQRQYHEDSYAKHYRVSASHYPDTPVLADSETLEGEQLLLDENLCAQGEEFFKVGELVPTADGRLIAWSQDTEGDERWTWIIQDASSGDIIDQRVSDAGYGFAWAADSQSFIYTRVDDAWRQFQLMHHRVGADADGDSMLLEEPDEAFDLWFSASNDPWHVVVHSTSTTSGGAWLWDPYAPSVPPRHIVAKRDDVQVNVEPAGDHLLVIHTALSREGSLACIPLPQEGAADSIVDPECWVTLYTAGDGERLSDLEAYRDFFTLSYRRDALPQARYYRRTRPLEVVDGKPVPASDCSDLWALGEELNKEGTIRSLYPLSSGRFEDCLVRVGYQSVLTSPTVEELDLRTGKSRILKVTQVPNWDPSDFTEERVWVTARDGHTQIPVTLVHRRNAQPDGTHAGWIHGYGSYEVSFDPEFDILRLPALKRGVVHAIAHIRGGGEMGRSWYEDGKKLVKTHTFTDFLDVANYLVDSGWVHPERLIAEGRSAGGLLMGAVTNAQPDRFAAVIAGVPFVDALTTILDPSLPLTVGEWEEWGNPIEDPEIYALMRSYTPYENVCQGVRYPAIMATTSINDTRVFYVEPHKWVQRLREATAQVPDQPPIVIRTEMVAGHAGASGRKGRWQARAQEFAFALHQVGITK